MGLDQYLFKTKETEQSLKDWNYETQGDKPVEQLYYWRKHANLQGYMQDIWVARENPEEAYFNCVPLFLTKEDIDQWEEDMKAKNYPSTTGFFFGTTEDFHFEEDAEAIAEARKALEEGYNVYYDSWW